MPKKEQVKIPKKVKEEMTEQIIEEIGPTVKESVKDKVVEEIRSSFNQEFKDEIRENIKNELIDDIKRDISKQQKRLIRSKNFKIVRLYVYLLIVVAALLYLLFRLYETDTLTIIDKSYTRKPSVSVTTTHTTTEEVKNGDFYIGKYGYLMDSIKISNVELLKKGVQVSNMEIEEKLSLAYANLEQDAVIVDGIIHSLSEEYLINSYLQLFGETDSYSQSNFVANGLNYAYSSSNSSYMAIGEEEEANYIQNVLVDGYQDGDTIAFEAKCYVIKNDFVYSPLNMSYKLMSVSDDMELTKVYNKLLSVEYKFEKNDNGYNLISISRK